MRGSTVFDQLANTLLPEIHYQNKVITTILFLQCRHIIPAGSS